VESSEKEKRPRRSFTKEFKAEVVELVRRPGPTAGSVARDLDLTETAVRDWVKQADIDEGGRDGLTTDEREELTRLRKEVRVLREERDILKRATVCSTGQCNGFGKDSGRRPMEAMGPIAPRSPSHKMHARVQP
jgi:transposase